jgi:dethiobiotin synthetase
VGRSFLISGTDTAIGKTTVGSAIAAALRRRGLDIGVSKPIETGCERDADGVLIPVDAMQLRWAAGREQEPVALTCPYALRAPLAPSVAARAQGLHIELSALVDAVRQRMASCELVLVEGAGGLLVPMTASATVADLALACELRLVVVVGNRLGAINHARLTLDWARAAGLTIAGYVVNALGPEADLAARTNVEALRELLGPALGVMPFLGPIARTEPDRERLADAGESIDLEALLAG